MRAMIFLALPEVEVGGGFIDELIGVRGTHPRLDFV